MRNCYRGEKNGVSKKEIWNQCMYKHGLYN